MVPGALYISNPMITKRAQTLKKYKINNTLTIVTFLKNTMLSMTINRTDVCSGNRVSPGTIVAHNTLLSHHQYSFKVPYALQSPRKSKKWSPDLSEMCP